MGEALNREGQRIAEAFGATKREVFDKLFNLAPDAHEFRIKTLEEKLTEAGQQIGASNAPQVEMPRWRCHKVVHALKIDRVFNLPESIAAALNGGKLLTFVESVTYAPRQVDPSYVSKHNPQPGGYFVVYDDGYQSFSPAKAFEDGYTRI